MQTPTLHSSCGCQEDTFTGSSSQIDTLAVVQQRCELSLYKVCSILVRFIQNSLSYCISRLDSYAFLQISLVQIFTQQTTPSLTCLQADLRDMVWRVCGWETRHYHGGSLRSSTRTTICLHHSTGTLHKSHDMSACQCSCHSVMYISLPYRRI